MSSEILGEFENLFKRFSTTDALNGLSFKIFKGINGLIGPNGAGKTTTIKLILGLIRVDSGKATMFGFDCWNQSLEIRQNVGVLYEKVAYYDHLTGIKHLQLIAKLKGLSDPVTESKKALKLVDLDQGAYDRKIMGYSSGMRQRIGLAHALLGKPKLVILDEPTSNLDPLGRVKVIELINRLNKEEDISFLVSSHILPELERVCEHVILMNKGKAIREGSLNQLLHEFSPQSFVIKAEPATPLIKLLKVQDFVKDVQLKDDIIFVIVSNPTVFKKCLPELVSKANASLEEVKAAGNDLESLFKEAIGGA